jgi:LAO/AO transport system kinase
MPILPLVQALRNGNRLALARVLTQVENDTPAGRGALNELFPYAGQSHLVGVTGSPGTGKSTLVNQLAFTLRHPPEGQAPNRVGVVAIDPTSPFSGGAILGDRLRMRDLAGDPGIFIRSMASRGALGGLAHATAAVVQVLDAAGFDTILIETVGAGQAEVEIAHMAHTTLVIEAPGMGDDIQAIKAGILEIADILIVNKADLPGADRTERILRSAIELVRPAGPDAWQVPILRTAANSGSGIPELVDAIACHRQYLSRSGEWDRRTEARIQTELEALLQDVLVTRFRSVISEKQYQQTLSELMLRKISPHQAIQMLISDFRL